VIHPHNLAALAALHSLREAYGWLTEVIEAEAGGAPAPRSSGAPLDKRAQQRRDALIQQERSERENYTRRGLTDATAGMGASPMPARAALLDARANAEQRVDEVIGLVSYDVRTHRLLAWTDHWRTIWPDWWQCRTRWMLVALNGASPYAAQEAARTIGRADATIRTALDVTATQRPCGVLCPACGGYSLVWEGPVNDPSQWTVTCTLRDCRCTGSNCPCGIDPKVGGAPHRWPGETALSWAVSITEGVAA
jgi:hypothetical protein